MNHFQALESVRDRVRQLFANMGACDDSFHETVLIRDGHYCGRRFELDGMSAVWFIEENQVKCFSRDGALHSVVDALGDSERHAA